MSSKIEHIKQLMAVIIGIHRAAIRPETILARIASISIVGISVNTR